MPSPAQVRRLIVMGGPASRPAAAPSITVTTQGATLTAATSTITASGEMDSTIDSDGNRVETDAGGLFSSATPVSGWTAGAPSGTTVVFTKDVAGAYAAPTLASGNGSVVGTAGVDAAIEVFTLDFDDATGGTIKVLGSAAMPWNADAATVETAITAVYSCTVTGAAGLFEVTAAAAEAREDATITQNLLTK